MGAGASAAPYNSVEDAIAAGKTQEEIDAWLPQATESDEEFAFEEFSDEDDDGLAEHHIGEDGAMVFGGPETVTEEEALAVKPFIGAIFPPSDYSHSASANEAPSATLSLEYCFGYCKKTRSDVFSLPDGRVLWPSAAVGVMLDSSKLGTAAAQSFLQGHQDEITAMAQSPINGNMVATGCSQLKRKRNYPKTIVWNCATGEQVSTFQSPELKRQVDALCWDPTGTLVFAAGAGDTHNVHCFRADDGTPISFAKGGTSRILLMGCIDKGLYVAGVKSLQFFATASGLGKPKRISTETCTSLAVGGNAIYVGTSTGNILSCTNGGCRVATKNAHVGGVRALACSEGLVASGGKKGEVTVWSSSDGALAKKHETTLRSSTFVVKGLAFEVSTGSVLCGSKGGEVCRLSGMMANASQKEETLAIGHFDGETWGLAMHPFDNTAATTGDDNTLRFWDLENLTMTKSVPLTQIGGDKNKKPKKRNRRQGKRGGVATTGKHKPENCSRALSFCNVGENIAVGMNDGSFLVLRESDLSKVCQKKNPRRQQWIQDLKYSPLDDVLAVSTHDNFIDLWSYDAGAEDGNYAHFGQCDGHRSFVTHLDWSACGRYLQTNCGAYELLFWDTKDVEEGGQRKVKRMGRGGSELCDTEWSTQNCVIAFACTGIWYCPEGYTLNCVDKSKAGDLLAVGEDSSLIKLYKYPCVGTFVKSGRDPMLGGAQGNAAIGHGSHVSNLKFSFDDSRVVSVGGDDNATMVWKVVR